jgi:flagellin-specific chaperone FliS
MHFKNSLDSAMSELSNLNGVIKSKSEELLKKNQNIDRLESIISQLNSELNKRKSEINERITQVDEFFEILLLLKFIFFITNILFAIRLKYWITT